MKKVNKFLPIGGNDKKSANISNSARLPTMAKLKLEKDELLAELSIAPPYNGDFYEEESAWRFHNPAFPKTFPQQLTALRDDIISYMSVTTPPKALQFLLAAPPLPELPATKFCN